VEVERQLSQNDGGTDAVFVDNAVADSKTNSFFKGEENIIAFGLQLARAIPHPLEAS
jgi:hypothetical protein